MQGLRTPAHRESAPRTGAGVGKPPVKEPAGGSAGTCRKLYGDSATGEVVLVGRRCGLTRWWVELTADFCPDGRLCLKQ
jgi:hypothetical protein